MHGHTNIKFKILFNSRLKWEENYRKMFMWMIQKVIKDLIVYRAVPERDCSRSFVNASSAFSWFSSFLLWNPKVYIFTIA